MVLCYCISPFKFKPYGFFRSPYYYMNNNKFYITNNAIPRCIKSHQFSNEYYIYKLVYI